MTATHWALIVTHAAYVLGAVVLLYELVRLRRSAWRTVRALRHRGRGRRPAFGPRKTAS